MGVGRLTINLDAIAANWRALDTMTGSSCQTAAVVKANGYGLGVDRVARALAKVGARRFFVAVAEEGAEVRRALGPGPEIAVLSGHMDDDTDRIRGHALTPMLNSTEQLTRHLEALPGHPFGIQLDVGMSRLGLGAQEWAAVREFALAAHPQLLMAHLTSSEETASAANSAELTRFHEMTDGTNLPRSLANSGGVLLGADYHFDLTRPGVALYGGMPFEGGQPVVQLSLPVIQLREIGVGETVGYNGTWRAEKPTVIATLSGGYADGLLRALTPGLTLWAGDTPCPAVGRVSMDLITVDVTHLGRIPQALDLLGPHQDVNTLATAAGTIGYEVLTSLGARYTRRYTGAT